MLLLREGEKGVVESMTAKSVIGGFVDGRFRGEGADSVPTPALAAPAPAPKPRWHG